MPPTLNQEIVTAVFNHMCREFDATIVQSKDFAKLVPVTDEVELFFDMLKLAGVDVDDFFNRYAFSLGRFVIVPYTPGVANPIYSLRSQIINLCHELIHRLQWRDDPNFIINYTTSRSKRAHYEAEALHANWMLYHYFTGRLPRFAKVSKMAGIPYLLRDGDIETTKQHLSFFGDGVKMGTVKNDVVDEVIKYLGHFDV